MKKTLFLALGLVVLASCTKDYNCDCTETETYMGVVETYKYDYTVEGANKTQAQAACNEATISFEEGDYSSEQVCTLSKQ